MTTETKELFARVRTNLERLFLVTGDDGADDALTELERRTEAREKLLEAALGVVLADAAVEALAEEAHAPLVPSEGQCAYPVGGGGVCRLPPGHDGAHGVRLGVPAHPAVGVATVDGKATCPKCSHGVESRATYARVPEHRPSPAEALIYERGGYVPPGATAPGFTREEVEEAMDRAFRGGWTSTQSARDAVLRHLSALRSTGGGR